MKIQNFNEHKSRKLTRLTKEELEALALAKQKNTITRFSPTELRNSRNTLVNNSPNDLIPSTRTSSINPSSLFSPKKTFIFKRLLLVILPN